MLGERNAGSRAARRLVGWPDSTVDEGLMTINERNAENLRLYKLARVLRAQGEHADYPDHRTEAERARYAAMMRRRRWPRMLPCRK